VEGVDRIFHLVVEALAEHGFCAVEADLDVGCLEASHFGRLLDGEVFYLAEDEDEAIFFGKFGDRVLDCLAQLFAGNDGFRRSHIDKIFAVLGDDGGPCVIASGLVALVEHDPGQPGAEGGAVFELSQVFVGADIGGLHGLFHLGVNAEDRHAYPVEPLVIAADDDLKKLFLSGRDPFDELLVRGRVRYGIGLTYHNHWINRRAKGYGFAEVFFCNLLEGSFSNLTNKITFLWQL